mmetsp:Transcript_20322/g.30159  ORF Transcript_20322/g.30159 Transcript_20322/m.30159 type:complete len:714 (-) Transcript_20322:1398-3539(-)|eukprot:CAMPEP_0194228912 /NCGR_PEP_ID=MMETSP0156-20130528/43614_1 /TAXON_ID=33649 /ORGANISM="Thalassionema nitzschioides, Strain L26-B" /LENGTH=713 /DNA_ID=CAMNT_0038961435 /DNA_START=32 /DNA_END=2173 /DNA_ORIENTATION=+
MASSQLQLNDPISAVRSQSQGQQQQPLEGIVAYLGHVKFADRSDDWVGVRLTGSSVGLGKNDGSVEGERYFSCGINSGIFVRKNNVVKRALTKLEQLRLRRELAVAKARGSVSRPAEQRQSNDANISSITDPTISPLSDSQRSLESSEDKGVLSNQISDLLSQVTNLQCNLDQVSEKLKTKVREPKSPRSPSSKTARKPDEIFVKEIEEDRSISSEKGDKEISGRSTEPVVGENESKELEVRSTSSSHEVQSGKVSDFQPQEELLQLPITQPHGGEIMNENEFTNEDTESSEEPCGGKTSQDSLDLTTALCTTNQPLCDDYRDNGEGGKEAIAASTAKEPSDQIEHQIVDEVQQGDADAQDETISNGHNVKSQAAEFLEKMKVLLHNEKAEVDSIEEAEIEMEEAELHMMEEELQMEEAERNSVNPEPHDKYAIDEGTPSTDEEDAQNSSATFEQNNSNKLDEKERKPVKSEKEKVPSRFHDQIENRRLQGRIDELELYMFKLQSKLSEMADRLKKKDQEADFLRQSLSSAVWDAEEHINRAPVTEAILPQDKRRRQPGRLEVISEGEEFDSDLIGKLEAALEAAQADLGAEREARAAEAEQHRVDKLKLSALHEERLVCEVDKEKVALQNELANLKLLNQKLEEEKLAAGSRFKKVSRGKRSSWLKTSKKTVDDSEMNSDDDSTPQNSGITQTGSGRWSSRWKSKNRDDGKF